MIGRRAAHAAAIAAVVAAAGIGVFARQTPPTVVPVEREPQHRPVFRNDVLAVLDVRFPPRYTSLFHRHSNDNVSVRIETAPTRTDTPEAMGTVQTAAVGRVVFNSARPPYVHRVANLGDTTIRILDIEVLAQTPTRRAAVADDLAGHEIVVENERVRLSRITLAPGGSLAAHTHPRGWLEIAVHGREPGAYVWHEPGAMVPAISSAPAGVELVEIDVK
jgi:hypothetical protein